MSWLAKSLASSLRLSTEQQEPATTTDTHSQSETVKEHFSDLTHTLTRQFWGFASFLSSQTDSSNDHDHDHPAIAESPRIDGIRNDLVEIGNQFKSGISLISSAKVVTEVSKIATSFLHFGFEEEDGGERMAEEVVVFVKNLAMHPKTWVHFPQFDAADLELSEAQEEHILAIEHLVPELIDLKNELCPSCMHEGRFWTIYFLLLIPTLAKDEAELLSSPQIIEARELLLEGSLAKPSHQPEHPDTEPSDTVVPSIREPSSEEKVILPVQTEEHFPQTFDAQQTIDKTVTEEELMTDKSYNWSEEEIDEEAQSIDKIGTGLVGQVEVDVSFSDLEEDDDDDDLVIKMKKTISNENETNDGICTGSSSESNKSSEWLKVDDLGVD